MEASPPTTDRLEAFSDGVFAVAATLLVLNLSAHVGKGQRLADALGSEWPHYATYVVSFLTIGIIWLNHHVTFNRIARTDRTLMVLNLVLLMFVTLTPFPTGLLAQYLNSGSNEIVAAAFYATTMLAMSIAFFSIYVWAARRRLFADEIDDRHAGYLLRRNGAGLLVYAAAIALAFVSAPVSLGLCGLVAIYYLLPARAPTPA
ncbi:MAG TPA: TMEM175 family protein [Solirubrobacteraceae bacterium]|nr:TMEM175 family protein [Solirubrobacteraceae bacterium]